MEDAFRRPPGGQVGVRIGYDEALSHRLIAGGDAILVPSRFEPCGLTQMYGLRYGTVPVVALTGVLRTPLSMPRRPRSPPGRDRPPVPPRHRRRPARRALAALRPFRRRETWARLQRNAMAQPVGWQVSARAYARLYRDLVAS
jgi:starch synthase